MNKKNINILLITIIFFIIFLIFKNNYLFLNSINESLILFITKVFPFLFIMMILNNLLIKCNLPYYLNKVFKKVKKKNKTRTVITLNCCLEHDICY